MELRCSLTAEWQKDLRDSGRQTLALLYEQDPVFWRENPRRRIQRKLIKEINTLAEEARQFASPMGISRERVDQLYIACDELCLTLEEAVRYNHSSPLCNRSLTNVCCATAVHRR